MSLTKLNRRHLLQAAMPVALWGLTIPGHAAMPTVKAYRDPGCGCCEKWAEQMKSAGFEITMADDPDLAARNAKLGVPSSLAGCHTALIGDYVFEGHVPPDDIIRFLKEKPAALGLAVPGMPVGSPGMEMGDTVEPFDVLMFTADGATTVFAGHL